MRRSLDKNTVSSLFIDDSYFTGFSLLLDGKHNNDSLSENVVVLFIKTLL